MKRAFTYETRVKNQKRCEVQVQPNYIKLCVDSAICVVKNYFRHSYEQLSLHRHAMPKGKGRFIQYRCPAEQDQCCSTSWARVTFCSSIPYIQLTKAPVFTKGAKHSPSLPSFGTLGRQPPSLQSCSPDISTNSTHCQGTNTLSLLRTQGFLAQRHA